MNLVATLMMVNSVYAYFIISLSMIAISNKNNPKLGSYFYLLIVLFFYIDGYVSFIIVSQDCVSEVKRVT